MVNGNTYYYAAYTFKASLKQLTCLYNTYIFDTYIIISTVFVKLRAVPLTFIFVSTYVPLAT